MRVLLADDHPLYLEAARARLERQFPDIDIIEATGLEDALAKIGAAGALDLVLLDFSMPGMHGAAGVADVVARVGAAVPVAVMSGVADPADVADCIAAGAKGYLPKTLDAKIFSAAVSMILLGGTYLPVEFAASASHGRAPATPPLADSGLAHGNGISLSAREMEVLTMLVGGAANKEMARDLGIEEVTIKLHMTRIFKKLGVRNRAQAAVRAMESGLVRR